MFNKKALTYGFRQAIEDQKLPLLFAINIAFAVIGIVVWATLGHPNFFIGYMVGWAVGFIISILIHASLWEDEDENIPVS